MPLKYIVIVGDGMADYPLEQFGNKTALQYAVTPNFDLLAGKGTLGLVQTIPESLPPGSDVANLSLMGYDPLRYYSGRSPFEAASIGVDLHPEDVSFRCNLVTLSADEPYEEKILIDYSSGDIATEEAKELIEAVNSYFKSTAISFYTGLRYRHLMVWEGTSDDWKLTPPHDISGRKIKDYLPAGQDSFLVKLMMEQSYRFLSQHSVNLERVKKGLKPANSIWLWGNGRKPLLPLFFEKYGLAGSIIADVDLMKGIGLIAGLELIEVENLTGDINTLYAAKARAALDILARGQDFVYIHIEEPDECSHRFETDNKVKAIELIDQLVVKTIKEEMDASGFDYSMMLLTDHATPLSLGTHTREPVPFVIYRSSDIKDKSTQKYDEVSAFETGVLVEDGSTLLGHFLGADEYASLLDDK
ncbi:MAG TPA: cofactor-independent phosphoglycerate mutase [Candidatus Limnocylindrales bacterium]|nr:cofactor-independent phosphoglycerate mutase [Candidatus Limnocylindrales bacterium]